MVYCAAVEKIEEAKPEDFFGHRKRDRGIKSAQCNINRQNKYPETLLGVSGFSVPAGKSVLKKRRVSIIIEAETAKIKIFAKNEK